MTSKLPLWGKVVIIGIYSIIGLAVVWVIFFLQEKIREIDPDYAQKSSQASQP